MHFLEPERIAWMVPYALHVNGCLTCVRERVFSKKVHFETYFKRAIKADRVVCAAQIE